MCSTQKQALLKNVQEQAKQAGKDAKSPRPPNTAKASSTPGIPPTPGSVSTPMKSPRTVLKAALRGEDKDSEAVPSKREERGRAQRFLKGVMLAEEEDDESGD